jgi:hypothetical protein
MRASLKLVLLCNSGVPKPTSPLRDSKSP